MITANLITARPNRISNDVVRVRSQMQVIVSARDYVTISCPRAHRSKSKRSESSETKVRSRNEYESIAEVAADESSGNESTQFQTIALAGQSAPSVSVTAQASAVVGNDSDGIETVDLNASEEPKLSPFNVGGIFTGYPRQEPKSYEDGVEQASFGSTVAFTIAIILLVVITGGTLYVSAREAMDRKEEADAREAMERQERIVEANKGRLNREAKKRKPKSSNLDKLVADGIIKPGSSSSSSTSSENSKKLNRKERRERGIIVEAKTPPAVDVVVIDPEIIE
jgi:hypothetical protein